MAIVNTWQRLHTPTGIRRRGTGYARQAGQKAENACSHLPRGVGETGHAHICQTLCGSVDRESRHGKGAYWIIGYKLRGDVSIRRDGARCVSPHSVLDIVVILPFVRAACTELQSECPDFHAIYTPRGHLRVRERATKHAGRKMRLVRERNATPLHVSWLTL